jgi:hypothetical protein
MKLWVTAAVDVMGPTMLEMYFLTFLYGQRWEGKAKTG